MIARVVLALDDPDVGEAAANLRYDPETARRYLFGALGSDFAAHRWRSALAATIDEPLSEAAAWAAFTVGICHGLGARAEVDDRLNVALANNLAAEAAPMLLGPGPMIMPLGARQLQHLLSVLDSLFAGDEFFWAIMRADQRPGLASQLLNRNGGLQLRWARTLSAYASREVSLDEAVDLYSALWAGAAGRLQMASGRWLELRTGYAPIVLTPEQTFALWQKVHEDLSRRPDAIFKWRAEHGDWAPWKGPR